MAICIENNVILDLDKATNLSSENNHNAAMMTSVQAAPTFVVLHSTGCTFPEVSRNFYLYQRYFCFSECSTVLENRESVLRDYW